MSKKTRKKSPKTPAPKAARAKSPKSSAKPSGTSAKTPAAKTRKAAAAKSGQGAGKKNGTAAAKASHTARSKLLRKPAPAESKPSVAVASHAPAAKAPSTKPILDKAPAAKAGTAAPRGSGLSEGAKAPAFRLPRDGGDTVSLGDFKGRKLVLFFYPRADTPGCTREAIDFTRLSGAFAEHQTAVLGVSADPLKAQESFRDKHELTTPLVSDESHGMLEAYGVWGEKSMYGKTFLGIVRTTVLVDTDGRVLRIWRNVKVDGHAEDVLEAVRAL